MKKPFFIGNMEVGGNLENPHEITSKKDMSSFIRDSARIAKAVITDPEVPKEKGLPREQASGRLVKKNSEINPEPHLPSFLKTVNY